MHDRLAAAVVWNPAPGSRHAEIVLELIEDGQPSGNLISDAHLVAIAIEHSLVLASNDSDQSRFVGLRGRNLLTG